MKDKSRELNFNFDDVPVRPVVERTPRTEQATAPSDNTARNTSHIAPSGLLTPNEVMNMGKQSEKPIGQVGRLTFNEPPKKKETKTPAPTMSGDYSGAALSIMQKMKQAESSREAVDTPVATVSVEDKFKPSVTSSAPSQMSQFLNKRAAAQVEAEPLKVEVEPLKVGVEVADEDIKIKEISTPEQAADDLPVMPVKVVTDISGVADLRQEKVDSFTLDFAAMEANFDNLDSQPTVVMPVVSEPNNMPADGSTRMFDAVADNNPIYIPDDFDDDQEQTTVIDEYNSVDDAQSVTDDLTRRKKRLTRRSILSALCTVMLLFIAFIDNLFPFGQTPYFIAVGVLLGLVAIINLSSLLSLTSVFKMKADIDFAPSFALLGTILQTACAAFFGVEGVGASAMLGAVAAVAMTFSTLAKRNTVKRTLANFELIANEEPKAVGTFITPPVSATIADPEKVGESLIFGRRSTIDMKGFISHSLSADLYEKHSGKLSVVIAVAALIATILAAFKLGNVTAAVTALAAVGCAGAQIAAFYPSAVLLYRVCRRLRGNRVMLSGFKAAEEISDANVVVLDSDELFRDDDVSLFKFRTFGDISPDIAFMTAAALTLEGHSPLAGMFTQIASTNGMGMLAADSAIYEDGMGLTGWVDEHKTLLGNRMIMESHSIPVPSIDVDRRVLRGGHFPLYLAIDDKLAAMFIIGYSADKEMLHRVRRLVNTGVTMLVRTVDPNVTADLICESYGLPTGSVEVMSAHASRVYCEHTAPSDNEPAILYAPSAKGFTDAYISAFSLHRSANVAAITALVLTIMAVALCVALPIFGLGAVLNVTTLLSSYAVVAIITALVGVINS